MQSRPAHQPGQCDRHDGAPDMPQPGDRIALMNVATDGVRLIAKDKTKRLFNLAEILPGVDPDQRAGGAVFFA